MNLSADQQLKRHVSWQRVLSAYHVAQRTQKIRTGGKEGWVARLVAVAGIPDDDLPRIHGQLIAYGLLRCHLTGRAEGLLYQVSPAGQEALQSLNHTGTAHAPVAVEEESPEDAPDRFSGSGCGAFPGGRTA